MFDFFKKNKLEIKNLPVNDRHLLVACILIESAKSDDKLLEKEINSIKSILIKKLNLDNEQVEELFSNALKEVEESVELYSLTRDIKKKFSHEQILELFEDLWEIIIVDEHIDDYEAALMSKLSGLLNISGKESSIAKQKVLSKLNLVED